MAKRKREEPKPAYVYTTSDIEARYKIFMNPDPGKRAILRQQVLDNAGYCPKRVEKTEDNKCMCKQFRERDSEGFCKHRLYYKEARTEKAAEAYKNAEFKANEKKEKEIESQVAKEEKVVVDE